MSASFSQIATADILTVVADILVRSRRVLDASGNPVDLREKLRESFHTWGKKRLEEGHQTPLDAEQYRALENLFWYLFDQSEAALRVYDDPAGEG